MKGWGKGEGAHSQSKTESKILDSKVEGRVTLSDGGFKSRRLLLS